MHAWQVPSFDSRVAMMLMEKELGAPWTAFFSELSPEPIAAASLGQVRTCCMQPAGTRAAAAGRSALGRLHCASEGVGNTQFARFSLLARVEEGGHMALPGLV